MCYALGFCMLVYAPSFWVSSFHLPDFGFPLFTSQVQVSPSFKIDLPLMLQQSGPCHRKMGHFECLAICAQPIQTAAHCSKCWFHHFTRHVAFPLCLPFPRGRTYEINGLPLAENDDEVLRPTGKRRLRILPAFSYCCLRQSWEFTRNLRMRK